MNWDADINLAQLKFTTRLIVKGALSRGWRVCSFATNPAVLVVYPKADRPIYIFSASPPQMSYPASKIANDKFITNQLLTLYNLPVPKETLLRVTNEDDISPAHLTQLLEEYSQLVVKPLDASHGKGITTHIRSLDMFQTALKTAAEQTKKSQLVIQEHIEGIDIRALCIGYKFVDAISRSPASVMGDGVHTVRELIDTTNVGPERGENYKARLNYIPVDKAASFLSETGMNTIPSLNQTVQVIGVSNIGMGGERNNIKQSIPPCIIELAEQAARALQLPVCGVDFIVSQPPQSHHTIDDLNPRIIEVNACPMLTMYEDLKSPEQQTVIDTYLDYISQK